MSTITLRHPELRDAETFYAILSNPNFVYFDIKPKSLHDEKVWLMTNPERRKKNHEHNYAILCDGKPVGGCGIKISQHKPHTGEIGYFLDESHWGKGITSRAVTLLEEIGFNELQLTHIEIVMDVRNKASEMVAIKCGYTKKRMIRKAVLTKENILDCYLYVKVR